MKIFKVNFSIFETMTKIIVEIDSAEKAATLKEMLDELSFVKKSILYQKGKGYNRSATRA